MPTMLRTTFLTTLRASRSSIRPLSTTARLATGGTQPPPGNQPPSAQGAGRSKSVADDPQSSASTKKDYSGNSGDDHPAKQPDAQAPSERSTGFQEVDEVKGGKEGLGARDDK